MFDDDDLTDDAFLGGKLQILQPRDGYRAATDPVLLAACVEARAGQTVLDMGCGVGTAALCLGWRVPGLHLSGLELQSDYAALARRNAARAGIPLEVVEGSVLAMPKSLRHGFDHVISNPPYFHPSGTPARDQGRDVAMRQNVSLAEWIKVASRRLAPGGWLWLILRVDGLDEAIAAMRGPLGSLAILPLAAREGRAAGRVILRARKGGRAATRLLAPLILHDGLAHETDGDRQSAQSKGVMRDGAGLTDLFR